MPNEKLKLSLDLFAFAQVLGTFWTFLWPYSLRSELESRAAINSSAKRSKKSVKSFKHPSKMKNALRLSTLLVILSMACAFFLGGSSTYSSSSSPRICLIQNCAWNSTVNACARMGRSNLCNRFRNACALNYQRCVSGTSYTNVSLSQCSGITVGNRGTCRSSSSTSTSSSNVIPIIIRRG